MHRTTFIILGLACVAVGIVGAFLPILPSTIFFILAAACFARSSPRLEKKILDHPVFGPPVISWREHGAIPLNAKLYAIAGMCFGYASVLLGHCTAALAGCCCRGRNDRMRDLCFVPSVWPSSQGPGRGLDVTLIASHRRPSVVRDQTFSEGC